MRQRNALVAVLAAAAAAAAAACGAPDEIQTYSIIGDKADLWTAQTIRVPAAADGAPGVYAFEVLADASFQCAISAATREVPLALAVDGAVVANSESGALDHRVVVDGGRYRALRLEVHNFADFAVRARLALQPPEEPLASLTCSDADGNPCDLSTHDCVKGKLPSYGGSWPALCEPKTRDDSGRETCAYGDGVSPGYLFRQCGCSGAQYCLSSNRWSAQCDESRPYFTCNAVAFCDDVAAELLLARLEGALKRRDGEALAALVAADGLRLRRHWWAPEVTIAQQDVVGLLASETRHDWGVEDGSGEPIVGSFAEVMLPLLESDLLAAGRHACDELLAGTTAGMVVLPDGYEALHHYSYLRPAADDLGFDWGSWTVGLKQEGDAGYAVSYLVHYGYEI